MNEISVPRNGVRRELPCSFGHMIHPAGTPVSGFQPPQQGEINLCCLETPPPQSTALGYSSPNGLTYYFLRCTGQPPARRITRPQMPLEVEKSYSRGGLCGGGEAWNILSELRPRLGKDVAVPGYSKGKDPEPRPSWMSQRTESKKANARARSANGGPVPWMLHGLLVTARPPAASGDQSPCANGILPQAHASLCLSLTPAQRP